MEHQLRVLVRFNTDLNYASVAVRGCLTDRGCDALLCLIRRARLLSGGIPVVVNLRKARHIDQSALDYLQQVCADERHVVAASGTPVNPTDRTDRTDDSVTIDVPGTLPQCPALRALHNADAARMAFLAPNPSVFGDRGRSWPPALPLLTGSGTALPGSGTALPGSGTPNVRMVE